MKRLLLPPALGAVTALGALLASPGLAAAGTVGPGAIAGTVTEAVTGEPVADLVVMFDHVEQSFFRFAITGADGRYTSPPLAPGAYFVQTNTIENRQLWLIDEVYDDLPCFNGECDQTIGTPVAVRAGETTAGIDFALDRGGVIAGRVTREADGEPLAGALIEVWSETSLARSSSTSLGRWVSQ